MGWKDRVSRMQASIVGDFGPSQWATYKAPNGASVRVKGVFEAYFHKQSPGDFDVETYVVSRTPTFGVRHIDFTSVAMLRQNGELVLDDDPAVRYRVTKVEAAQIGWSHLVLEKMA